MTRLLLAALATVALVTQARAGAPAPPPSMPQKFAGSEVVATGKVTAIEKEKVDATAPGPGAKEKVAYAIAVVKLGAKIVGAENATHIKVGFVPPDPNAPPLKGSGGVVRPREPVPELKDGQEVLLFLVKHSTADFYVMPARYLPVDLGTDAGKKESEQVKRLAEVLADPVKALKADKADARGEAAGLLLAKYRAYPASSGKVEQVALGAEESKLLLKALAEADWLARPGAPGALAAFYQLGLTDKDGWKEPAVKPGEDFTAARKDAFAAWLDGPGKDYVVKKFVAKK